jgi:hypothetical protein
MKKLKMTLVSSIFFSARKLEFRVAAEEPFRFCAGSICAPVLCWSDFETRRPANADVTRRRCGGSLVRY